MFSYLPPILNRITWGVHINSARYIAPPPDCPEWLTPLQKQDWQGRGVVVWDMNSRIVTHLYARNALNILEHMQTNNIWKTNGFTVGSWAYQLHHYAKGKKQSEEADNQPPNKNWIVRNRIELSSDRATDLFAFLVAEKESLEHIAIHDDRDAREALREVYRLIAAYGRKIREGKQGKKVLEAPKKKIIPTTLPKGSYFTVPQTAQICSATPRQIRAWIWRGKLEAFDLPGLGIIIEAGKLNEFLYQKDS